MKDMDWTKVPAKNGITIELCAGIVDDPKLSLAEIVKKEILEECGYEVPLDKIEKVIGYRCSLVILLRQNSCTMYDVTIRRIF